MNTDTLPYAVTSPRVGEALKALVHHINYAITLTGLEPVKTSEPVLSGDSLPPLPKVTEIKPDEIAYEDRQNVAQKGLQVIGQNLDGVREVRLIQRHVVGALTASALDDQINHSKVNGKPDGKSFTAQIAGLSFLPPGSYKLQLINETGETTLSPGSVTIHSPKETYSKPPHTYGTQPAPTPPAYGIEEMIPPFGHAGQTLCVRVIGKGACFTDQTCFTFAPAGPKVELTTLLSAHMAVLKVCIPSEVSTREFELRATTGTQADSAAFTVHQEHENWWNHLKDVFGNHKAWRD
ncbi:MAG TPA: hypothetical protein VJU77_00645 [Chthoniobacterales bacterium]|nr:hypothetical protein [Chthoniobacterales bacterium]